MSKTFTEILQMFEATEANLVKLERLCKEILQLIPEGFNFGANPEYDDKCRAFMSLLSYLPMIDGWKPDVEFYDLEVIAGTRIDYWQIDEPEASRRFDRQLLQPEHDLKKYRFLLGQKRRKIIRDEIFRLAEEIDKSIDLLIEKLTQDQSLTKEASEWTTLNDYYEQIDTLLGSNTRPDRWYDMRRHLHFGMEHDAYDIKETDWPAIKGGLMIDVYTDNDPVPVNVADIGEIAQSKPSGSIPKKLNWEVLSPEEFERLIYSLLITTKGYQNAAWLTKTNAADKGRDLSVELVTQDPLNGKITQRVIVQCKHYLSKSVSLDDVATLPAQMKLWEPPKVDFCIIVTSGRFTTDAISFLEKENQEDRVLKIKMWAESHLESLLASRPDLIGEFKLR